MIFHPEEEKPIGTKIIRNAASGALRVLLVAPVPFLLTPLILHKVGAQGYGTWAVLMAISNLSSLSDIGLLGTLSKYVAEYHAKQDLAALNRLMGTGLAVFGLIAVLAVSLLWLASDVAVNFLFRGSAAAPAELRWLFSGTLILVGLNILTFPLSSVTSGLQRLDLTNLLTSVNVVGGAVMGAAGLFAGKGVRGLLYGNIFSAGLTLALYVGLVRRLLPHVRLSPWQADAQEAKKVFRFSSQLYVTQAAVAIQNQFEKLVLAFFVGVSAAGWYDIASDIAAKIRNAVSVLLNPILPAASELNARGDRRKLIDLFYRAHKYLACVAVPLFFYFVTVSRSFVNLWIGPALGFVATPFAVLLLVNLLNLATAPGFMIFAGQGRLRPGIYSGLLGIGLNVPLSIGLIYFFGFRGAVIGTSISMVTASFFFMYLFHRLTGNSAGKLVKEAYFKPLLCVAVLLTAKFLFFRASLHTWLQLFLGGVIFLALYTAGLLLTKFFDRYDWMKARSALPIARINRRIVSSA